MRRGGIMDVISAKYGTIPAHKHHVFIIFQEFIPRDKQSNEIMGRKKDGNERHKMFGVCRSYKVIMKWKNGRIVKKKF